MNPRLIVRINGQVQPSPRRITDSEKIQELIARCSGSLVLGFTDAVRLTHFGRAVVCVLNVSLTQRIPFATPFVH